MSLKELKALPEVLCKNCAKPIGRIAPQSIARMCRVWCADCVEKDKGGS